MRSVSLITNGYVAVYKRCDFGGHVPLDHYVSQVHLRKFYSPSLHNQMYAISKKNLKSFTPTSESVCRISDGSTNSYLREGREIEEFLKTIEPKYTAAVEKLASNRIDAECIYTIAGFVAYVASCSPGAMRIHSSALQGRVEKEAAVLDTHGMLPPPPAHLAGLNLREILKKGMVSSTDHCNTLWDTVEWEGDCDGTDGTSGFVCGPES